MLMGTGSTQGMSNGCAIAGRVHAARDGVCKLHGVRAGPDATGTDGGSAPSGQLARRQGHGEGSPRPVRIPTHPRRPEHRV
jgi:hypothetical protein